TSAAAGPPIEPLADAGKLVISRLWPGLPAQEVRPGHGREARATTECPTGAEPFIPWSVVGPTSPHHPAQPGSSSSASFLPGQAGQIVNRTTNHGPGTTDT